MFSNEQLIGVIGHAFELILFFSGVPVVLGLAVATVMRRFVTGRMSAVARTVLFLPQVVPLVAAGIAWSWMLSTTGVVDQVLSNIGLGRWAQAWLGGLQYRAPCRRGHRRLGPARPVHGPAICGYDQDRPSLVRVGPIGRCRPAPRVPSNYFPALRQEIAVCVTVTVIAALSAFDIVYISTQGGPGNATMVPGLEIYQLAFYNRQVGLASALALVLMVLVIVCILPVQWFARRGVDQ